MSGLIVIPARWGSTRFPGKPLAPLRGRTLLQRVVALAQRAAAARAGVQVVVATDDERIADHAATLGVAVMVGDGRFDCGTERVQAAAERAHPVARTVVNLQGDAPFVAPDTVLAVIDAINGGAAVATPVVQLDWPALDALRAQKRVSPFSGTTCIRRADGRALWFSKAILPAIRDEQALRARSALSPVLRHIGLYGYTRETLDRFVALPPSPYERHEGLEQLRLLEAGIAIEALVVDAPPLSMSGIDTPDDLDRAGRLIDEHGEPEWM